MGGFIGYGWLCLMCGESGNHKTEEEGWPCSCAFQGVKAAGIRQMLKDNLREWELFEMVQTAGQLESY